MEGGLPLRILYEKLEKQLESSRNENRLLKEEIEVMELAYNTLEDRYYKLKEVLERLPVDIEDMIE
jgi:predicted nuclease with TOPRIM domain